MTIHWCNSIDVRFVFAFDAGFGANCSRAMRRNASLPFAKLLQLLHEPHT